MKVIYGTSNINKLKDMQKIIKANNANMEAISLKDINFNEKIEENGKTFEENSKIKAIAVKNFCNKNKIEYDLIITDDAGLCIDSLKGKPGVYSARYAGENATQEQILNKIFEEMKEAGDLEKRTAQFVCVLTTINKEGKLIVSRGECKGKIATKIIKLGGLTFSPIFIPNGFNIPMSELSAEEYEKAGNHRNLAFKKLLEDLEKIKNN